MKLSEAIALEATCERMFESIGALKDSDPILSMALTGKLKLSVDDWFFSIDMAEKKVVYFSFYGDKAVFDTCIAAIEEIVSNPVNTLPLELLLWSYQHQRELEVDVE